MASSSRAAAGSVQDSHTASSADSVSLQLQNELAAAAQNLNDIHRRLASVAQKSEHETRLLQLEVQRLQAANSDLTRKNHDLSVCQEAQQARVEAALEEQAVTARKLRHARRVIRDLLDERAVSLETDGQVTSQIVDIASKSPVDLADDVDQSDESTESEPDVEADHAPCPLDPVASGDLQDEENRDEENGDEEHGIRADSATTLRVDTPSAVSSVHLMAQTFTQGLFNSPVKPLPPSSPVGTPPDNSEHTLAGSIARSVTHRKLRLSTSSVTPRPPPISVEEDKWKVHFVKPPTSAVIKLGRFSWQQLGMYFGLPPEMIHGLESLALIPGHGLRLQIERNMAFVYDPIFLESPDTVYLIDWGSKLENQNIGDYMDRNTQNSEGVLHTFLFVLARAGWYYIGAHKWTLTPDLWVVWPTMEEKGRMRLATKIHERCNATLTIAEISEKLDGKELRQLAIEISSSSLMDETREFVRNLKTFGREIKR